MDEYIKDVGILKYEEGKQAGIQKGIDIKEKEVVQRMYRHGFDPEMISTCTGADLDTVQKWLEELALKK